jgi:hypothetical protein
VLKEAAFQLAPYDYRRWFEIYFLLVFNESGFAD